MLQLPITAEAPAQEGEKAAPEPALAPTAVQAAPLVAATDLNSSSMCAECKQTRANTQCSLRACLKCCAKNVSSDCRVTKHQAEKERTLKRPLHTKLEQLLSISQPQRPALYIKYNGGTRPGTVRAIIPTRWAARLTSFYAISDSDPNTEKKYIMQRGGMARQLLLEPFVSNPLPVFAQINVHLDRTNFSSAPNQLFASNRRSSSEPRKVRF
jgi:hypothetical protein